MQEVVLKDRFTGDLEPFTVSAKYASGANRGDAIAVSLATALIIDPDLDEDGAPIDGDTVSATADADGTTTSFVSTDIAELGNDFLNGVPCKVTKSDGRTATVHVEDYVSLTGTLTLSTLPWAVEEGDELVILGYPVQVRASATVGGTGTNEVTCNAGAAALSYAGRRHVLYYVTFSDAWKEVVRGVLNVFER